MSRIEDAHSRPVNTSWLSEIRRDQLVRAFAASPIDPGRGHVYQIAMGIEGGENSCLVGPQARLNSFQCVFIHVK
jgi:hypothetical protein